MYKFLVIAFLFLIAVGIYEQNNILLMNDEEKQSIVSEKEVLEKKRLDDNNKDLILKKEYTNKMSKLSNTHWSEIKIEQYFSKIIADKIYLWILLLFFPVMIYKIYKQVKNGY
jgi:hypothetical protein